jgi:MscS family membrane protein
MIVFDPPTWVPAPLLRVGPYQLALWQWLGLPLAAVVAWIASRLLGGATHSIFRRLARRTSTPFDDEIVDGLAGPIALAWFFAILHALVVLLELPARSELFATRVVNGGLFIAFFWALFRFVDVGKEAVHRSKWSTENPASRSLLALGSRVAKAIVGAMTIIAVVSALGYPVASLIAGLGIGGLALALAAQKTVENLFGAFAIGFDQPIREGDFVLIDGIKGTVESIGLRSTRVRTPDRTIVCFPNGRLADMRTENYAARDRLRLLAVLGLTYDTTAEQMRRILAEIEAGLRAHPKFHREGSRVRFKALSESSLDVEVDACFDTTDWEEFTLLRQDMLLSILDIIERAGAELAFPTQTVLTQAAGTPRPAETVSR